MQSAEKRNALGSWLLALGSWLLALGSWLLALGSWFLVFGFLKIADLFLTLDLEKPFKIAIPAQAGIHDCASYCDGFPPARE
jgi:hypothetical protein